MKKAYTHIIWDWNGTLYNDVEWCYIVINEMLSKRNMKTLDSILEYQRLFCFPIINYYKNVGFNFEKESFDEITKEFILLYHSEKSNDYCKLHNEVFNILELFYKRNKIQIILSASERNNLLSQVYTFNIKQFFHEILGLSNIHAKSKLEIGISYTKQYGIKNAVLIGDTVHDFEVANGLNIDCLLISKGHQNKEKLITCNVPVLENLYQIIEYIE